MQHYTYAGRRLEVARYADMPHTMRPNGKYHTLVQELIHSIKPWDEGEDPIETMEFDESIYPMALPRGYADVTWGVHRGHRARVPGLSPFVQRGIPHELMGFITVELVGTPEEPLLVRAYGGDYTPPLPWMVSAKNADGGLAAGQKYWQSHAYLMQNRSIIREGSETSEAPNWFRELQASS